MTAEQIYTGDRFFCWWKSRFLYFTGNTEKLNDGEWWKFEDVTGCEVWIHETDLEELERR